MTHNNQINKDAALASIPISLSSLRGLILIPWLNRSRHHFEARTEIYQYRRQF